MIGLVQGSNSPPSSRQLNWTPSWSDWKVKVALLALSPVLRLGGRSPITVTGADWSSFTSPRARVHAATNTMAATPSRSRTGTSHLSHLFRRALLFRSCSRPSCASYSSRHAMTPPARTSWKIS